MIKKQGDFPINSRISIYYAKDKPEITFGYPEKEHQMKTFRNSSGVWIMSIIASGIIALLFLTLTTMLLSGPQYPENCTLTSKYNSTLFKEGTLNCSTNGQPYIARLEYSFPNGFTINEPGFVFDNRASFTVFIFILLYFISPFFWAWFFSYTKIGNRMYPKLNKLLFNKRYSAEFTTCPSSKIIELPLFANIFMDYDAEGEFGEYLQKVEIVEHDFNYNTTKGKEKITTKNVFLWKAIFTFSKQPREGRLKIAWT